MSKRQLLCVLGILVIVFLFLGLTAPWHRVVAVLLGLAIVTIAYNLPHEKSTESTENPLAFTENSSNSNNSTPGN